MFGTSLRFLPLKRLKSRRYYNSSFSYRHWRFEKCMARWGAEKNELSRANLLSAAWAHNLVPLPFSRHATRLAITLASLSRIQSGFGGVS